MTRLRGYANTFNEVSAPIGVTTEFCAKILPGAFRLLVWPIEATVMHSDVRFATTFDQSLRLWQDDCGLAIEADIPETPLGSGLMSMVAGGACSMSIGLQILESERVVSGDMPLHIVSRAEVDHVTVCDSGAFASARCWLDSMPVEQMQHELAAVARRWRIGRAAHESRRHVPAASLAKSSSTVVRAVPVNGRQTAQAEQRRMMALFNVSRFSTSQWRDLLRATERNSGRAAGR